MSATVTMLNPNAPIFVPSGRAAFSAAAPASVSSAAAAPAPAAAAPPAAGAMDVSALPDEILACVASHLDALSDIAACVATSRQVRAAVHAARPALRLSDAQRAALGNPANAERLGALVAALCKYTPAAVAANLSGVPLEPRHVAALAGGLPQLRALELSACRKLTPGAVRALLGFDDHDDDDDDNNNDDDGNGAGGSRAPRLVALNLQRCFQLTRATLSDVLAYAAGAAGGGGGGGSSAPPPLQVVALSHLNLAGWPQCAAAAAEEGGDGRGRSQQQQQAWWAAVADAARGALERLPRPSLLPLQPLLPPPARAAANLRILALNNCGALSAEGLAAVAAACPRLEHLLLGGCSLEPLLPLPAAAAAGTAEARLLPPALAQLAEQLALPEALPWAELSSCCGGSSGGGACACVCCARGDGNSGGCRPAPAVGGRAGAAAARNEPSPAALAAARGQALAIALAVAALPCLRAVEVTFLPPGVAGWLRAALARLASLRAAADGVFDISGSDDGSSTGDSCCQKLAPRVWDLSCGAAVAEALEAVAAQRRSRTSSSSSSSTGEAGGGGLATALACAANCSNRGRSTPLHVAADRGCAAAVAALLRAGAVAGARDAGGAGALFVAAEAGRAAAVAELLAGGADPLAANTAGETPLYIAALRGHVRVVDLLLQRLAAAGVDWMRAGLYGDAWTPLMAAAVANRVDVTQSLLRAATRFGARAAARAAAATAEATAAAATATGSSGGGGKPRLPRSCGAEAAVGAEAAATTAAAAAAAAAAAGRSSADACVERLLAASNRYGQTVLHIAARKGSRELLRLLLTYGAAGCCIARADAAGETPMDVARRHGHDGALRELLGQAAAAAAAAASAAAPVAAAARAAGAAAAPIAVAASCC